MPVYFLWIEWVDLAQPRHLKEKGVGAEKQYVFQENLDSWDCFDLNLWGSRDKIICLICSKYLFILVWICNPTRLLASHYFGRL